jgi:type IX secretion system PorP/SprF family membrane protein
MSICRNILLAVLLSCLAGTSGEITAQLDYLASQYNFNSLMLNPAYAGAHSYVQTSAMYRSQWSIEGAPTTQIICVDGSLKRAPVGIGLVMTSDKIGVVKERTIGADFSYHFRTRLGRVSFGLRAGHVGYSAALDDLDVWDEYDPVYSGGNLKEGFLTLGFGAFFSAHSGKWFGGISVPSYYARDAVLRNTPDERFYKRHIYAYGGGIISTNIGVDIKPSMLLRYVDGVPLAVDVNLHALFIEDGPGGIQLWVGLGYRVQSAFLASMEVNLPYNLRLGYSYDFVGNGLYQHLGASHEIQLGYNIGGKKTIIQNPRYF